MKKKKILIVSLLLFTLTLTGCTSYLKDEDKRIVKNETTGQNLVENILCKPMSSTTLEKYDDNNVNLDALPECSDFKITSGGYEGIWTSLFVKPLAWLLLKIGFIVKNFGLSIII